MFRVSRSCNACTGIIEAPSLFPLFGSVNHLFLLCSEMLDKFYKCNWTRGCVHITDHYIAALQKASQAKATIQRLFFASYPDQTNENFCWGFRYLPATELRLNYFVSLGCSISKCHVVRLWPSVCPVLQPCYAHSVWIIRLPYVKLCFVKYKGMVSRQLCAKDCASHVRCRDARWKCLTDL